MAITKTTYSLVQGSYVNVLDYMTPVQISDCLSPTGGTLDVTSAIQAAIDASWGNNVGNNNVVFFPAGRYLVTATINLHAGTKLKGVNIDAAGTAGAQSFPNRLSDSKGTVIVFNPSTQQSLFVPVLPKGGSSAWSAIGIDGFNIWGNTSKADFFRTAFGDTGPVVETSLYAIDFANVQMSSVRNVAVMGFMSAIRERDRCQNNNYDNIYIQYCRESGILFSATTTGVEITDSLFTNVRIWSCLHAVQMISGGGVDPLQVRFNGCFFNSFASHAVIISSGARELSFIDCYCEGVGLDTSVVEPATFWVTGSTPIENMPVLNVISGQYAGATGSITPTNGVFLKTDICGGVNIIAVSAKRYTTGIICTANTRDRSIYLSNPYFVSVTGSLFDTSTVGKIIGTYRTVRSDGGSNVVVVNTEFLSWSGDLQILAPTIRLGDGSSSSARPGGDNTMSCGVSFARWSEIFAANGVINTSDSREKQQGRPLTEIEKSVAKKIKGLLKAFKFNAAVEKKGADARIHFGVYAQDVAEAFASEGLDPTKYALFCFDEWEADETTGLLAGNRYGIRYDDLLAFIVAAL